MKFLIVQENGRHDANRSFRECFCAQRALEKLGHVCHVTGLNHTTENDDWDSYDFIINLENYDNGWVPDMSQFKKPYKILWSIDAHCKGIRAYQSEFSRGGYNLVLQATRDYVKDIPSSVWFPNCYDDTLITNLHADKKYRVGFCGNYVTSNRAHFIHSLVREKGLKEDIFVIGNAMVEAINSYQIHFNMNMANDLNYRNFETIGCGTVLLTNRNSQYESLGFLDGVNCLIYEDYNHCLRILDEISNEKLLTIGEDGLKLARQHTYERRMRQLCDLLLCNKTPKFNQ